MKGIEFKEVLKKAKIGHEIASKRLKISRSTLNKWFKSEELDENSVQKIHEHFDLNFSVSYSDEAEPIIDIKRKGVPVYDIEISAGTFNRFIEDNNNAAVIGYIDIPNLDGTEFFGKAKGDSMVPKMHHCDLVGLKREYDYGSIIYGKIYVVITESLTVVKYIKKSSNPDNIILRSENSFYDDLEVPLSSVKHLFSVRKIFLNEN